MRFRDVYLLKQETISDSQTKIVDIKVTEPITAIYVIYEATNGSTSNQGVHLHDDVDKIELVDGSDVLFSMSGILTQALDFYSLGHMPQQVLTEAGGATQKEMFIIPFGRYIGDRSYYLDPTKFTHLQLKCTHSLTISDTAGFATGTGKLTVIAKVFAESPGAASGFLMAKDVYDWTTAASGDEVIDLPTDYPYRLLMLRAFETTVGLHESITNVKLSIDFDKYIPFDLRMQELVSIAEEKWGHATFKTELKRTDGDTIQGHLAYPRFYAANAKVDMSLASIDAVDDDQLTLQLIDFTTSPSIAKATADKAVNLLVQGVCPHNCIAWAFGDLNNPDDWLPAPSFGDIKLKCTQGNAGASASVVLQQLRSY